MADSILRLKVESQEYDAKLKRAAQGLQQYADGCRKVGGTLEVVEQETLAYVRAIGQMKTTAKGAKATLAEMTKTFTDLSVQYNKLTDAEKQSPFGQALKGSLDQLQGRIRDSKTELDNINQNINGGGGLSGALDGLAGKFGMNITQLAGWGAAIGAAKAALDVAKDAFFANEQNLDEWGRTVEASESLYKGFLNSLNNGDIRGFLTNIGNITTAARAAYDALDELATFNAFNQVNVEKTRTGMTESIASYREGSGTKDAVKASGEAYKKELEERRKLEKEAYLKKIAEVAAQRGVSAKDLTDALSGSYGDYQTLKGVHPTGKRTVFYGGGMFGGGGSYTETFAQNRQEKLGQALRQLNDTELQSLQALGAQAERTGNEIASVDKQLTRVLNGRQPRGNNSSGGRNTTKEEKDDFTEIIGLIPNAEEAVKSLQQQIRESWDEGEIASLTKDLQRAEDELNRLKNIGKEVKPAEMTTGLSGMNSTAIGAYTGMVRGTLSNMDYGSPDYTATFANMIDAQTFGNVLQTAIQQGVDIAATGIDVEGLWDSIVGGENIPDEVWQSLQDKINEQLEAMQIDPIKIDFQTGSVSKEAKKMNDDWKQAASAIQSVGAAMMSIEDPTAKVMGTIAQAIASIALGAGQAIAQAGNGSAGGPWGWIAFAAAATATMISTIASVKSATAGSYADGGIVPGHNYNDGLIANVSSGELILNRAQQNNLASQLQGGGMGNMNLSATISGEQLRLVLNNNSRRRGHGEYVTTNFR